MNDSFNSLSDIPDKCILIKINNTFRDVEDNKITFYEATRKAWIIDPIRARKADYALSIYQGKCYAVFEVHGWQFSSVINGRDRYEFIGKRADSNIEKFYQSKDYTNLWEWGAANPITYVNC